MECRSNPDEVAEAEIWFDWYRNYIPDHESSKEPVSDLYMPIFETDLDTVQINPDEHEVVGMIAATWFWRDLIKDLLPEDHQGFVVVFENPCNPSFTYQVDGPVTTYLGRGDLHDTRYDKYDGIHSEIKDLGSFSLSGSRHSFVPVNEEYCQFHISIYPSETMEASFTSQDPVIYMCVAILIFVFTSLLFVGFDFMVRRRHKVVLSTAETSNAVVSSLYPEEVRDRIKQTHIDKKQKSKLKKIEKARRASTSRDRLTALRKQMKSGEDWDSAASLSDSGMFLFDDDNEVTKLDGSPIAEVYSETTVMMADIVGFPAWSSARGKFCYHSSVNSEYVLESIILTASASISEPIKVFSLLEAIYSAFDTLSSSYDVFKIESVGDMYVAVSGLPTPERRHAVIMAQFAQACLETVKRIVLRLESKLGPGTADLRLRVGLNSGPVTGGVLRNDKAIFQIFGDTVNVANKMLSTSIEDRIQASQKTAKELMNAGRDHWVFRRLEDSSDPIEKGPEESVLKTYWVEPPGERKSSTISNMSRHDSDIDLNEEDQSIDQLPATVQRLVTWNLGQLESILVKLLKQTPKREAGACLEYRSTKLPRSERSETIFLLNTESTSGTKVGSPSKDSLVLDVGVQHLLSDFISSVAFMYQEKKSLPYHNFEHSANAAMSALKMLSTLAPIQEKSMKNDSDLRITYIHLVLSDPMVQLAIVFAMLVHSLEHRGCPNSELVRQNDPCSKQYEGKSITEQHSIDTAWDLFMDPGYKDLRSMMFRKSTDIMEFRRLFVNSVIATDLEDAELKASQEARWRELFEDRLVVDGDSLPDSSTPESRYKTEFNHNRRAALIIEMIIQVSVISEYTQHWKVYEKQRRHQFKEIYQYSAISNVGRRRGSPSCEKGDTTWYDKELAFFDKFVIPLLKKTKLSGVFWESSIGMMLDYAQQNRAQWAEQGQDLIQKWIEEMGSPASSKPRG
jgi:class 3 adenylate cyclase